MAPVRIPIVEFRRSSTLQLLLSVIIFFQFQSTSSQSCVPYFTTQQPDSRTMDQQSPLWCKEFFSRCNCIIITSSSNDLTLSEAERQIALIVDQAESFGVSRQCRTSFVSLYCNQVYKIKDGRNLVPGSSQRVCSEDCERTISTDCRENWNILSNIVAQFIERGTIQLPALRQLEDCAVLEPTIGGTGMENVSCISLQPLSPPSLDCLITQETPTNDTGNPPLNLPLILGVSIGAGASILLLLVTTLCIVLCACFIRRREIDHDGPEHHKGRRIQATNPAMELEYIDVDHTEPGSTTALTRVDHREVKSNGTLMLRPSKSQGVLLDVNLSPRTSTLIRHIGTQEFIKMSPKQRLQSLEFPHDNICLMKNLWETNFGWTCLGEASGMFQNEISSTVFIKSLREHASSKLKQQFRIEMTWVSGFSHPNIIQLLAVCTKEQPQYMIFEYLEYGSLKDFLQSIDSVWEDFDTALNDAASTCASSTLNPALGLEDLVNISWQVANGMDYLTKKAFILKDLAARNCQVGHGLQVKIANFGLSYDKHSQDYCCLSSRKSTPLPLRWLAPETIQHNRVSVYTDIWSFGVLLWEVFSSGQRPYGDLTNAQVVQNILGFKLLPRPSNCPKGVYNVMLQCWNEVPLKRPWFSKLMEELKQVTSNLDPEDIKMLEASAKTPDLLRREQYFT